jgi:hypothetical protein
LAVYLLSGGILAEASGASPLLGLVYLLMVGLCPFLPQLLAQVTGGPLDATHVLYLCVGLSVVIAVHVLTLSMIEIKVGDTGISCKRFLRKPLVIDWKDVHTVECRVVNRMDSSGIAVSTNAKMTISTGKARLGFSSMQFKIPPGEIKQILEKARPAAVEWTLRVLQDKGEVPLGPVRLCRTGFKVRGRLYCHMQVGGDSIQLEEGRKKVRYTYDRLLNGQYLMEILDRAKLRA